MESAENEHVNTYTHTRHFTRFGEFVSMMSFCFIEQFIRNISPNDIKAARSSLDCASPSNCMHRNFVNVISVEMRKSPNDTCV